MIINKQRKAEDIYGEELRRERRMVTPQCRVRIQRHQKAEPRLSACGETFPAGARSIGVDGHCKLLAALLQTGAKQTPPWIRVEHGLKCEERTCPWDLLWLGCLV